MRFHSEHKLNVFIPGLSTLFKSAYESIDQEVDTLDAIRLQHWEQDWSSPDCSVETPGIQSTQKVLTYLISIT